MDTDSRPLKNVRIEPARVVEVPQGHEGRRLDKFLRAQLKGVPATLLFRLMRKGQLRVNDRKVEPGYRLQIGDILKLPRMEIPVEKPKARVPSQLLRQLEHSVVYEDDALMVINKPADIAVHVGTGVSAGVIETIRQLRPQNKDLELVHRLDRETSGLLMIAKTSLMLRHLQEQLRENTSLERSYQALVQGSWPGNVTEVNAPLKRTEQSVIVDSQGQDALTRFSVIRRFGRNATLIQAQLITGRKHQIRVHTQNVGHPIAGDEKYGSADFNRKVQIIGGGQMFLHAAELIIPMPDGKKLRVNAPTPTSWQRALGQL